MTAAWRRSSRILVQQLSTLVQSEGRLLRSEVRESGKEISAGAIEIVAGAGLLVAALVILLQALVQALAQAGLGERHGPRWSSELSWRWSAISSCSAARRISRLTNSALPRSTEQLRKDAHLVKEPTQ